MDIKKILAKKQDEGQIQKLYNSATFRKKDLKKLVQHCKEKLDIYQEIIEKKINLLEEYQSIRQKFQKLSPGIFSALEKQYEEQKRNAKKQTQEKVQNNNKRIQNQKLAQHYYNHQVHTKQIKKIDKRRK